MNQKKLLFATSNQHKLEEIRAMAPVGLQIIGLADIGFTGEIPETRDTIEGNSLQKAEYLVEWLSTHAVHSVTNVPKVPGILHLFSEDTGLEIETLNGEPGVYSARYAGPKANFADNINKVLAKMEGKTNRKARFKTVITYYNGLNFVQFEGITEGSILENTRGGKGFGYDSIFVPDGSDKTYAEMTLEEKNRTSHRRKSFEQFANHLHKKSV